MKMNNKGFVSLFTAILLSMLLLIITVSLVSIQALQLRKAVDAEQSVRAYYAAEAGVEDAVRKVLDKTIVPGGPGSDACNAGTTFDTAGAADWTCQNVTFSGSPTGKLDAPDMAKTIDPGQVLAPPYRSVIIEWNQSASSVAGYYNKPALLAGSFPIVGAYDAVPPLELSILEYPAGGFSANQVCTNGSSPVGCVTRLKNLVLVPTGPATAPVPAPGGYRSNFATLSASGPHGANCGQMGRAQPAIGGTDVGQQYNCFAVLNGVDSGAFNYLFRIRSRYAASSFRLTFKDNPNGVGAEVRVPDGTATIDVTAKAGQTYRRVISKLPMNSTAAAGLNFVIYSDTDICKNFEVFNNVPSAGYPCP